MKGIESVMRGYADGGSVNPFQDYAGGPQSFNPFAALSYLSAQGRPDFAIRPPATIATPVAQTGGGYRDIYGNLEAIKAAQAAKKAAEAAAKIVPEPPSGQGTSAGDAAGNPDPSTAGGTATTDSFRDFALAALTGPVGAMASVFGQAALAPDRPITNAGIMGLIDAARQAFEDRALVNAINEVAKGESFGPDQFGGPGGRSSGSVDTFGGVSDADIDAAAQAGMDAAASSAAAEVAASPAGADIAAGQGSEWARGGYVPGGSGGMDDDVPAIIDGKQPAKLSSGEFVFDAATVAALGDGNNAAGAKKLDGLRKAIRQKAYGHERQPPKNYSVGDLVRMYDRRR